MELSIVSPEFLLMQIGYARVSTQDQNLRLQYEALHQVPCDKIYEDKASGARSSCEIFR